MYLNKYNKFLLLYCAFALLPLAKMAAANDNDDTPLVELTAASNNIDVIDHDQLLLSAVMSGNGQEVTVQVRKHNANINMESSDSGYGLLHSAITFLDDPAEMMQLLIDLEIDKAQYFDAFELATQQETVEGAMQVANCLMKNGAEPKIEHMCDAAENGFADLVKLFAQKVDINEKDKYGNTPLLYAIEHCHKEVMEYLIAERMQIDSDIWKSLVYNKSLEGIKFLLENYKTISNFDAVNETGHTPLYLAALSSHYDVMELLINAGASLNRVYCENGINILSAVNLGQWCATGVDEKAANKIKDFLHSKGLLTKAEQQKIIDLEEAQIAREKEEAALANENKDIQKPDKELALSAQSSMPLGLGRAETVVCTVAAIGAAGVWFLSKYRN